MAPIVGRAAVVPSPTSAGCMHVQVGSRRAGHRGDLAELIHQQLAHARHQPQWRVAARCGQAAREEHERDRRGAGTGIAEKPFERLQEPPGAAGQLRSGLAAGALPGHPVHGHPDQRGVRREGLRHAAERQRRHHRAIRGRELGDQSLDRVAKELLATGAERLLIDDHDESPPGGNIVVGAVGGWQPGRSRPAGRLGAVTMRRSDRTRTDAVADADLDVRDLEIGNG